jgi:hypothetical protein
MLDFIDEPLDQIAVPVDVRVIGDCLRARPAWRDHGFSTGIGNAGTKAIGVVTLVGEQVLETKAFDQAFGLDDVVDLAWRQDEPNRIAESVNADVDFGTQAAARTPDRLIFASPFLAPAACWCARTMVESMIRYSKSGSSTRASKMRCQTPFLAQRRKRWNTLFQWPNSAGRSRHGAPARTSHSTASTNKRLSSPCRPLSPSLPGISGSMRCHCALVSARRIKITPSCDLESHSRVEGNPPYVNRT